MSNIVKKNEEEAELRNKIKYLTDLINNASQHKSQNQFNNFQRTNQVQEPRAFTFSNTSNNSVKRTSSCTVITGSKNNIQKSKSERYVWKKRLSPSSNNIPDTVNIPNKKMGNQSVNFPGTRNLNTTLDSTNTGQRYSFRRNATLPQRSTSVGTSQNFVFQQTLSSEKNASGIVKNSLPQGQANTAIENTKQNVVCKNNLSSEKSSKYKLVKKDSSAESNSQQGTVKLKSTNKNSDVCEKPENTSRYSLKSENTSQSEKCEKTSSGNTKGIGNTSNVEDVQIQSFNSAKSNNISCIQPKSESTKNKVGKKEGAISPLKKNVVEMLKKQLTVTSENLQKIKKNLSRTLLTNKQGEDGNAKTKPVIISRQSISSDGSNTNITLSSKLQQSEICKSRYKYQKTIMDHSKIDSHAKLSPFSDSRSVQKKPNKCPQTQMLANVIKSKYKIGSYQTHWNKLSKNLVKNPSSTVSGRLNTTVNMKKFYDKMAKKYGWTNLDPTAQKVNMKKFYAKMAKKYGWTDLDSSSTSRINMKKFKLKMAKKYGWTDEDFKKSGYHTESTASHKMLLKRHTKKLHVLQTTSYFTSRKYRHVSSLPHASRMKLDRRKVSPKSLIKGLKKSSNLVLLNGVLYISNRTSMSKVVAGRSNIIRAFDTKSRFTINRKLKRNPTSLNLNQGSIESSNRSWNTTRFLASKAINRSIATATAKCRKNKQSQKQYCMFYNRFGRCNRGDNCPYIHDPERIAVCTRFLRGTCKVVDCPFSHKVAKEKMPVCTYFLKGVCNRDDCPYLHVNVSKSAIICPDFLSGYCSLGEKCKKKHTRICPEFLAKGTCSDGKKCNLIHLMNGGGRKKRKSISKASNTEHRDEKEKPPPDTPEVKTRKRDMMEESDNETDIPFKYRKLPTYISLDSNQRDKKSDLGLDAHTEKKQAPDIKGIRIKPQF